ITYNLPSVTAALRLDGPTLAQIYLHTITRWNDPAIAALNPTLSLPNVPIIPVHRSDGSGTTYIFSDYLSTVSQEWFYNEGRNKVIQWPYGVAGNGNGGVAAAVKQRLGGIGYVELAYAIADKLSYASMQNKAGGFVLPTPDSIGAAAMQFPDIYAQHFSIVDAPGAQSYPISGYSWVLLRRHPHAHAAELVPLFRWMTTTGQDYAVQLHYVPLPAPVQHLAATVLSNVA
ncbi:MAG TPA: phosphate ABC transporter substrate-binding protein PstS, partial [Chloroflexota bacterium]|nr:phosphate ABC transporter substrate-binding protein PstS [Chloroflexota bacterium]